MAAIIAQILRPNVRRFGGELAVHDAGFRALAPSLVPDGVACGVARQMMVGVSCTWV